VDGQTEGRDCITSLLIQLLIKGMFDMSYFAAGSLGEEEID